MAFDTAEQLLRESRKLFAGCKAIEVNLLDVEKTDSAGLALLLEWMSWARRNNTAISFAAIPDRLLAIAQTADVDELLHQSDSSSSK